MSQRVRMSPVDTAWLRMDAPGNLMMITGVQVFDGPMSEARLRDVLRTHLCAYREFRSRVSVDPSGAWWVEAQPDLDHHLVRMALPGAADLDELQRCVGQLASQALDPMKPLWQMHWVENFRARPDADPVPVLIVRIHHCLADGIALIGVLLSLTTDRADADPPAPHTTVDKAHEAAGSRLQALTAQVVQGINTVGDTVAMGLHAARELLDAPEQATQWAQLGSQWARKVSQDVADLALMSADTRTSLKGRPTGNKVVAWTAPLPLAEVKTVSKALGCSVNDVLLACVAGAFRAHLLDQLDPRDDAQAGLRALVPVNLRHSSAARQGARLGNRFGLVPVLLPIGLSDPVQRVLEVQRRMNALKGGTLPAVSMALLGAAGLMPRFVQQQLLGHLAAKATAVMTNVPGPQKTLYLAGAALKQMMFWVPQSGDIGVGVSVLSYDGAVQFGLMTDKAVCTEPRAISAHFAAEFSALAHLLRASTAANGHRHKTQTHKKRGGRQRKSTTDVADVV